ncbi:hypothetical protein COCC4DRAFT_139825 [Bipolaris maydis ATCC 48331]|uniref:Uncharacterized protein n=2 Tax=Cochliobolus heterostrophus TaxID=5016 RepID=M2UGV8_COCH5|nr:uncharacterized protein COCC4DRAFT_139825 [Bipolaris maydis ATCC 48331]EMD92916.1 hypothetical protein COCHEDRAFT_1098532 [Bipolaris maydis C5]KAJ5026017.1 hypothetical protein J3E73DRAFT_391298 [Bipolaris maydis]ENI04698.1 hypothetical protein COCC4DRAFT_139825 [Bipolaris maydis ATCC 48331]KAJ6208238.1 hypothetical protein PSV09DRAFT_1098532 [Bipolaris maydis]KAJ6270228.1 hypothetical protein PSV08DRAFT_352171 [Bipolaris maydis]
MAAQANGRAKKSKTSPNGSANGSTGASTNAKAKNSADQARSARSRKPRRTLMGAFTSMTARLTTWYLIITLLFRCPKSITQLHDDSPRVCKPYLQTRDFAAPYLDPYYETYVVPQLDKVKPYTTPAITFAQEQYATHGAHRVELARKYAEAQYEKSIRPQLQSAQEQAWAQYDVHLGPHVKKATDAIAPHYNDLKVSSEEIYHHTLFPAYERSLPYLKQGHAYGHHVLVNIVWPHLRTAQETAWTFIQRSVWPQIRILYGDNVEPQLVRISERLGRYKDQQKMESAMSAADSQTATSVESRKRAPTTASSSASAASPGSTEESGWGVLDDFFGSESASTASNELEPRSSANADPSAPKLTKAELQEKLNNDLRQWQDKFTAAADKGAEDLEVRVEEITNHKINDAVNGQGKALLIKLEETADATIAKLKSYIKKTVASLPEDASEADLEAAYDDCSKKTREFGLAVKQRAQDIRDWKVSYDQETDNLVKAAVRSTVEVLEKIHSLGLQEVGMRWAWTDGVTYKDWQNYQKLKNTLIEWQDEVEAVGSRHDGLRAAHMEAKKLEDKAMKIASDMVAELVRLKDVSKSKIWAGDASDDFSNKIFAPRIRNAAQQVMENVEMASSHVSEAIQGSSTPLSESIASSAAEMYSDASSQISEAIQGSSTPLAESVASSVKEAASGASSQAAEAVEAASTALAENVIAPVEDAAAQASSGVSEAIYGTPSSESVLSQASSVASQVVEEVSAKASEAYEAPKKVFGGANAQILAEAKQVVFDQPLDDDDEDDSYSEKVQEVLADTGDRAAQLSRAVSEALLGPSKTQGSIESASSIASEQYAKALAAASSVLYGTEKPAVEKATSVAADKYAQAVTAASYAIFGTPAPTAVIQTIHIEASSRYNDAVSAASKQFENAKAQLSMLVSGKPQPAHQTMLSYIEKAYSDSVAAASERLSNAVQYTQSVKNYAVGPQQGYFESVSSIAASRLSEGLSQASAQFLPQSTGVADGARRQYYEAIGLAHARYSEFVDAASSAVNGPRQGTVESLASVASASAASAASYISDSAESAASQISSSVIGSEAPWTESVASQASKNWDALISQASNQVYGQPTPWAQSVYSQAGAYGAQATEAAAKQYADVQALISELVVGKEPDFTESVMSRFASAYSTGLPAAIASAQSYAGDSYDAVTDAAADAYASATSVVGAIFTPPAVIEDVLSQASASLDLAVESASIALYGTPKGAAEQASESVASVYSSIQSQVSAKVYGTQAAQDSFSAAALSAQAAISEAIFGTPTAGDYVASVTSGAGEVYSSLSSAASSVVYGPEQGAMESANRRISDAVAAANSRISEMYAAASASAEDAASSLSSAATKATKAAKDEL